MTEAHCNNLVKRRALGLVTHDNTGGPFVVECQGCGEVYPSFHCLGGEQIADTGDYEDARCPHCDQVDPEECDNAALAWNTQQLKINELQLMLNNRDDLDDQLTSLEQRRYAEQQAREAAERRVEALCAFANEMVSAAFEGGTLDGADIQDIAVKHGVLRIETREEECGERCACREYGFPAECYRRTELIALNPTAEAVSHE